MYMCTYSYIRYNTSFIFVIKLDCRKPEAITSRRAPAGARIEQIAGLRIDSWITNRQLPVYEQIAGLRIDSYQYTNRQLDFEQIAGLRIDSWITNRQLDYEQIAGLRIESYDGQNSELRVGIVNYESSSTVASRKPSQRARRYIYIYIYTHI